MIFSDFFLVAPLQISAGDEFFRIAFKPVSDTLRQSVAEEGILQPLWVQKQSPDRFRLVHGFKRWEIARQTDLSSMPVACLREDMDDSLIYRLALNEFCTTQSATPWEITLVIDKLQGFGYSPEAIVEKFFPLLGLGPSRKLYDLYRPLIAWGADQAQALNDLISLDLAAELANRNASVRELFLHLIQVLKLSKNKQKEFWLLLLDISRLKGWGLPELLAEKPFAQILSDPVLLPAQKTERLKSALVKIRFPRYAETLNSFSDLLRQAKLPPGLHVKPAAYFAADSIDVDFSFKNAKEFKQYLDLLTEMYQKGLIEKIVNLP